MKDIKSMPSKTITVDGSSEAKVEVVTQGGQWIRMFGSSERVIKTSKKEDIKIQQVKIAQGNAKVDFGPPYFNNYQGSIYVRNNHPAAGKPKGEGGIYRIRLSAHDQDEAVPGENLEDSDHQIAWKIGGKMNSPEDHDVYKNVKGSFKSVEAEPVGSPKAIDFFFPAESNPKPTAQFSCRTDGLKISCNGSASTDPDTHQKLRYHWEFGDGVIKQTENPTAHHQYGCSGKYDIKLKVIDPDGGTGTTTKTITVTDKINPDVSIKAPDSARVGEEVVLRSEASDNGDIAKRHWRISNGKAIGGAVLRHTFKKPGVYRVVHYVEDCSGNSNQILHRINIQEQSQDPTARIEGPSTTVNGSEVNFSGRSSFDPDGTIQSYQWDFGDGQSTIGEKVTHTFFTNELPRNYTVTLTIEDNDGNKDTTSHTIRVVSANQVPQANIKSPSRVVNGKQITFDGSESIDPDGTINSYKWDFEDGGSATGQTATHTYFTHNPPKDFTTTLTVTDEDGKSDSVSKTVTVEGTSINPNKH